MSVPSPHRAAGARGAWDDVLPEAGGRTMTTESGQSGGGSAACRFCGERLSETVVDLGMSPLCESYLQADQLNAMEPFDPLHVYVCRGCWLVQLEQYVSAEHIYSEFG